MAKIKPLTGNHGDFSGIVLKAASSGNAQAVRHYLSINPGWLHQHGPHGRTMLWEAVYKSRHELVRELIQLGADVNAPGSYYTPMLVDLSPLAVAQQRGDDQMVELLIKHDAKDNFYSACHRGDLDAMKRFLKRKPKLVNQPLYEGEFHLRKGCHPIHHAVAGQQLPAVERLAAQGADIARHLTLLVDWAGNNQAMVRFLKEQAKNENPKAAALQKEKSNIPAVDRPDWLGFPPLVDACRGNHNAGMNRTVCSNYWIVTPTLMSRTTKVKRRCTVRVRPDSCRLPRCCWTTQQIPKSPMKRVALRSSMRHSMERRMLRCCCWNAVPTAPQRYAR